LLSSDRLRLGLAGAALAALAAALAAAWYFGLIQQLSDHERLVESMRSGGARGPLLCIAIQFVQVVIFIIPGEITQVAAGYVFGAWLGFVYSLTGILLGSAFAYGAGRFIGRTFVERLLSPGALSRLDEIRESKRTRVALFLLFLLPGAPKDALSYGAGVSGLRLTEFVLISGLGRLPALLASSLFGAQLYERDYVSMALTAAAALLVIGLFWRYQRRLAG
jgi:uncharacterized membrane protein YdjX (TVP38/TMEM64 family)